MVAALCLKLCNPYLDALACGNLMTTKSLMKDGHS